MDDSGYTLVGFEPPGEAWMDRFDEVAAWLLEVDDYDKGVLFYAAMHLQDNAEYGRTPCPRCKTPLGLHQGDCGPRTTLDGERHG